MATRSRLYHRNRIQPAAPTSTTGTDVPIVVLLDVIRDEELLPDGQFQVKTFTADESDGCISYIVSNAQGIALFVSDSLGLAVLPKIDEQNQIKFTYIFGETRHSMTVPLSKEFTRKFHGTYSDAKEMFRSFRGRFIERDAVGFPRTTTFGSMKLRGAEALWWQLFDKIILHVSNTEVARKELLEFARQYWQHIPPSLKQIEEFDRNYTDDRTIYWYTRESFIYQTLNSTLRNQHNINTIFKLRFIIHDLLISLQRERQSHGLENYDSMTVYRGAALDTESIEELRTSVSRSIVFNGFTSTSVDRNVAEIFAPCAVDDANIGGVLFTIKTNSISERYSEFPLANIASSSAYAEEAEVLIALHGLFRVESVLLNEGRFHVDLTLEEGFWNEDFGARSIFNPHTEQIFIRDLSQESMQFIVFQVLIDMVLRLEQSAYAKDELIEFLRSQSRYPPEQMNHFEANYRSEDALKWYTKESFLYRTLNETLRIETIDSIVKLRYYISDLHNLLADKQPAFIESLRGERFLTLYRGVTMPKTELNELRTNTNGFIAMNSFISASEKSDVAIFFSGDGVTAEPDHVSVVYEMIIDTNIRSTPYARIHDSTKRDEEEILFSIGATFRIGEVDVFPNHENVHRVKLTLAHMENELWNKLTDHLD